MAARLSILLTFVSLATADQEAISHGQNDDDIGDFSLSSGCDLQYHVANITVCHQGAVCYAPLHSTVVLLCPNEDGKWLHNSTILDNITSGNLTLTDVHYNDSGRYLYDIKEHCEYLLSVGEPPTVTAPKLNCHEGCCSLPITTVTTDSNDVYLICNTTDPQDTILWYNGNTPAKGTNNEEHYKLPYYHGKAGTIVHLTCVVTNHYGNATLTYNIVVKEAPSDDLSKYKEAIGLNMSRSYTEGSDVHLLFAIYQHESSLAKFCHFPNNTYNLLYGFLEFNHSTCCVCVLDDCTRCGNMNFTISSIADPVRSSYNYTIHLSDVKKEDFGLYTLLACVYQVNAQSCGMYAWTEVQVRSSHDNDQRFLEKNQLYFEISGGVLIIIVVMLILYCCIKGCSKKKGKNVRQLVNLPSAENYNEVHLLHVNRVTEVTPIKATETPKSIAAATDGGKVGYRHQPGQATVREGDRNYSEGAVKDQQPVPFQHSPNDERKTVHNRGKAFIIYSDEDYPEKDDCKHPALGLSDLLRHLGVDCKIDMYDAGKNINNWNQWTEQEVKNCDGHVILLCGKKLHQVLQKVDNERIEMHDAHIGKLTLNSLIDDCKINTRFVPVFIGEPNTQFIPTALNKRTCYTVPYDVVVKYYETPHDAEVVVKRKVCKSLYSLVTKLTYQQENDIPPVSDHSNGYSDIPSNDEKFQLQH